jgi:putative ABC transport system substrate-binding protein
VCRRPFTVEFGGEGEPLDKLARALAPGLASYGADLRENYRQGAMYVHRRLKGAHPRDLPVIQGNLLELVLNAATAKALGLTIPPNLLARADEVIE